MTDDTLNPEDLTDLERQVIERFQNRTTQGDMDAGAAEPGITGSATEADPDTPGNLPANSPAETPAEGGEQPTEPAAPAAAPAADPAGPATPDPTTTPAPELPQPTGPEDSEITFRGQTYSTDVIESALKLREWADGLGEAETQTIDLALSGDYVLVPVTDLPAIQQFYDQRNQQQQKPANALPDDPRWQEQTLFDDETDPRIIEMKQQLDALTAQQEQAQQAQQFTQIRENIEQGAQTFWGQNNDLDDSDKERLEDEVIKSGRYAAYSAIHDPATAIFLALNDAAASDEAIKKKRMDAYAQEQLAQQTAALQAQQRATAGSTALAGSSAPASSQTPPQDPASAFVADVARAMQA